MKFFGSLEALYCKIPSTAKVAVAALLVILSIWLYFFSPFALLVIVVLLTVLGLCLRFFSHYVGGGILLYTLNPALVLVLFYGYGALTRLVHANMVTSSATTSVSVENTASAGNKPSAGIVAPPVTTTNPTTANAAASTDDSGNPIITLPGQKPTATLAETISIPDAIAPARPNGTTAAPAPTVAAANSGNPQPDVMIPAFHGDGPCKFVDSRKASNGLVQFQSGDYYVTLFHCVRKGDRIQFTGTVQYQGPGDSVVVVGAINITGSPYGKKYQLGKTEFGEITFPNQFGYGYASQKVQSGTPVGFSVEAIGVDDSPITVSFSTRMGFGGAVGQDVSFPGLVLTQ